MFELSDVTIHATSVDVTLLTDDDRFIMTFNVENSTDLAAAIDSLRRLLQSMAEQRVRSWLPKQSS